MRALLLFALALVASASALVEVGAGGYHQEIGIPTAAKIKAYEEKILQMEAQDERIVGGATAPVNAHPYFGGLLISLIGITGDSVCGSSLVSANRAVTAAHCWRDTVNVAWQFMVILGSNHLYDGGTRIATTTVITHPQYIAQTLTNDIAVIILPTNVWFSTSIQPISLPSGWDLWNTFDGSWAVAAGFGRTSDQQAGASITVSHVALQVISVDQCQEVFGTQFVLPSTICTNGAGGAGICGGDSGGPLIFNRNGVPILIGVSSFVARVGCQAGHPSAFARVTSFIGFINQYL